MDLDVAYIANLARIELTPEEEARYQDQLGKVLDYMKQIDSVDVSEIEPTAHANPVYDVLRADEPRETLPREDALRNAPQEAQDQFAVTKVVDS